MLQGAVIHGLSGGQPRVHDAVIDQAAAADAVLAQHVHVRTVDHVSEKVVKVGSLLQAGRRAPEIAHVIGFDGDVRQQRPAMVGDGRNVAFFQEFQVQLPAPARAVRRSLA